MFTFSLTPPSPRVLARRRSPVFRPVEAQVGSQPEEWLIPYLSFDHLFHILGADDSDVYLRGFAYSDDGTEVPVIIVTSRKQFHIALHLWLDEKASFCAQGLGFDGIRGQLTPFDFSERPAQFRLGLPTDGKTIACRTFDVKRFSSDCDMVLA